MKMIILLLLIFMNVLLAQPKFDYENYKLVLKNNREISFTNSKDSYFYTTSHQDKNDMWFAGWNIAGKRIFNDYTILVNNKELPKYSSVVTVYPDKFIRNYPNAVETFSMLDSLHILYFQISANNAKNIGFKFDNNLLKFLKLKDGIAFFTNKENKSIYVGVATIEGVKINFSSNYLNVTTKDCNFLVIAGNSENEIKDIYQKYSRQITNLLEQRKQRISKILENSYVASEIAVLNIAISWLSATLNQLVTNQQGKGIYAGLPWFNQYWGRDMFISFAGACLVNGDYKTAREIMQSFAKFQNLDSNSKYYGRIPNRAQPTDIIYNTADGTPRFVISLMDYLKYTGDFSIISEFYNNVKIAIDGNIKYWVDKNGFLTHDDADTWMDAKKDGKIPFSPRGIAANDIQALWYQMLDVGEYFATYVKDSNFANICKQYKHKVRNNFIRYFHNDKYNYLADRLDSNYNQDWKFRPNQLFAYDLIEDTTIKANVTKLCWNRLTYPWGVASLWQEEPDFHPYHHCDWYYFDEAYHNGIVWLWLNGIMMQRMIEFGQYNLAYKLFDNMNKQAVLQGAVGSLAENADALPREGQKWANRSGAFLQAWSNAEHLRIWYQYFLGIQPELHNNVIKIKPSLPDEIQNLYTKIKHSSGFIDFYYENDGKQKKLTYLYKGAKTNIAITLPFFEEFKFSVSNNEVIQITYDNEVAKFEISDTDGQLKLDLKKNNNDKNKENYYKDFFKDADFVKPYLRKDLNIFKKR